MQIFGSNPKNVLLGGNDIEVEGVWTWTDGTPWDYEDWSKREPNNDGDVLKVMKNGGFLLGIGAKYGWHDSDSEVKANFLCAFDQCPESK